MADEFKLVEDFFRSDDESDADGINRALIWSGGNGLPVYAFHDYLLGGSLTIRANATLLASPTARFIRGFGSETNNDGDPAFPLIATPGNDQPNICI